MMFFKAYDIVGWSCGAGRVRPPARTERGRTSSTCAQKRTYCERKRSIVMLGSSVGALWPQTSSAMRRASSAESPSAKECSITLAWRAACSSHVALPVGRASPTDFATAVAAALVVPCASDHEGPTSSEGSESSDFVRGAVLRKTRRPGLIGRFCDCHRGGCECGFCQGAYCLRAKKTQLRKETLRVRVLSWHCPSQFQKAELHRQTLRLRSWHRALSSQEVRLCDCCNGGCGAQKIHIRQETLRDRVLSRQCAL